MKFFLLVSLGLIVYACSYAQNDMWTVKVGESVKEALGDSVIFRYPQFMLGPVYFRDGSISDTYLNLNQVNGEMQFIALLKDTMTINNEGTIRYITIGTDTFYYDKVYVELMQSNTEAKLGKLQIIKPVNVQKSGAYDQSSSVSSINSARLFYNNNNQVARLSERKTIVLRKETIYFIGNRHNNFLPAYKKNIFGMFNNKNPAIDIFIKENKIDFGNKDDLLKLVDFWNLKGSWKCFLLTKITAGCLINQERAFDLNLRYTL